MQRSTRTSLYPGVRLARNKFGRGSKFQARVWLGSDQGYLNLGLFASEREAHLARQAYLATRTRPPHLLPKYVRRLPDGRYIARARIAGRDFRVGPCRSARRAHRAMLIALADAFPDGVPPQSVPGWFRPGKRPAYTPASRPTPLPE